MRVNLYLKSANSLLSYYAMEAGVSRSKFVQELIKRYGSRVCKELKKEAKR